MFFVSGAHESSQEGCDFFITWAGFSRTFRICLENIELCPESRLNVQKIYFATKRPEKRDKRPGFVGRMRKLGRSRKLEVRGGSGHPFPTSNVQQPHQVNPDPPGRSRAPTRRWCFSTRYKRCHLVFAPCSAWVGYVFIWWGCCTFEVEK